jgi:hypothetical protein
MVAVGPIYPEQMTFETHVPVRNQMAALERAVANQLKQRGYLVLGTHPASGSPDQSVLEQIWAVLDSKFAIIAEPNEGMMPVGPGKHALLSKSQ